jgi:2-phospho-L-lactate transferase/gluconeogenesis factor (CofD/UPF0052 family)
MSPEQQVGTTKVAVFCGGHGSATIIREFLRWPNVQLTLLVNAYDDGLSTGALRKFIPGMLGPSDFRKNLSYLLDLYSDEQYALKKLIELRLPMDFGPADEERLRRFVVSGETSSMPKTFTDLVAELDPTSVGSVRRLLGIFLRYADEKKEPFDFRDCAIGNLLFAGCFLEGGRNFNAAAEAMSRLVNSQAALVNVCMGEDRILVALKADGELLSREADIVGKQSSVPILDLFFMANPISPEEWAEVAGSPVEEKLSWLKARAAQTQLSPEARRTIEGADIIVYGPGTQHSSLLPSYHIAGEALRSARAPVKAFIVNLGPDHDIQGLAANDLVDRALAHAGDPENRVPVVTHILFNTSHEGDAGALRFGAGKIYADHRYRGALVVKGNFIVGDTLKAHNGFAVVWKLLRIAEADGAVDRKPSVDIFVDLYKRSEAVPTLIEEFLEVNWSEQFNIVRLRLAGGAVGTIKTPAGITIEQANSGGTFPEVREVIDWIARRDSDFLVTITGDGEYRFRDVRNGIAVLHDSVFGAVYGSRTQSRGQFNTSVRAAYGEHGLLRWISISGAFLLTVLYAVRFGVIFSDPLTGFRIYRRRYIQCLRELKPSGRLTPTSITKQLVSHKVEIAELPVRYRTFVGFTDPWWRLKRGLSNLFGLLR